MLVLSRCYCDGPDPYCCNVDDAGARQQYDNVYGQQAFAFVKKRTNAMKTTA